MTGEERYAMREAYDGAISDLIKAIDQTCNPTSSGLGAAMASTPVDGEKSYRSYAAGDAFKRAVFWAHKISEANTAEEAERKAATST